ncbi:MAG: glutamate--tRNA ligase [Deltaproteobacteria bacterium HGW-Deltaproteobacteria-11]|nr:MAG: glutamate--tRNA ligase [Deltaproteobacteria bacterium HGW-Deltaproteobacteria-11]
MAQKVRVRFAPSPTGYLHVGGARTALFNWLYARHEGGQFILRIEDTDQLRSTEASTRAILDALSWLGLNWDEGPLFQAQRVELHRAMVKKLIDAGKAFHCVCTPEELEDKRKRALAEGRKPKYDGTCREKQLTKGESAVVRFRCPQAGLTIVRDLIKGNITFNNEELDDLVIERTDGYPTYNFAVVVDDIDMGITHVIRGDDHVNNTPRQILLYEALGHEAPQFGHVPMILGADKARLSKRHGATSVMAYQEMGYLPEALVNYLVRLGWSHGDQEIFSTDELIRLFSLESVGKSAAIFNPEKLLWLNQHYIKERNADRLVDEMMPFWERSGYKPTDRAYAKCVVNDLQTRAKTLIDLAESSSFYFQEEVDFDETAAIKFLKADLSESTLATAVAITNLPKGDRTKAIIEAVLRDKAVIHGKTLKDIAQWLRVAWTGKSTSPGLDEVINTLGDERLMRRTDRAIRYIKDKLRI